MKMKGRKKQNENGALDAFENETNKMLKIQQRLVQIYLHWLTKIDAKCLLDLKKGGQMNRNLCKFREKVHSQQDRKTNC